MNTIMTNRFKKKGKKNEINKREVNKFFLEANMVIL